MSRALLFIPLLGAGCAPAPVASPPSAAPLTVPREAAEVDAPLNLSAVAEPKGLLATMRINAPGQNVATIAQLVPSSDDVTQALRLGPEPLLSVLIGESLTHEVDLDAPMDMATVEPSALLLALPVQDPKKLRANATDFRFMPKGAARWTARYMGPEAELPQMACELWPARATVPYRLVCAPSHRLIDEYGPYLTRTVAAINVPTTARITFPAGAMKRLAAKTMKDDPGPMEPGEALGEQLAKDFFAELGSLSLDVDLEPAGVVTGIEIHLTRAKSLFATALKGRPEAVELPAAYWRLPKDAELALFFHGTERGAFDNSARPLFEDFWKEIFDMPNMDANDLAERVAATRQLFFTGGSLLVASGHEPLSDESDPLKARAALRGWDVLRADESIEHWRDGVQTLIHLLGQKPASSGAGSTAATPPKPPVRSFEVYSLWQNPAKDKLPAGSFTLRITRTPNPAYVPSQRRPALVGVEETHYLFFPEGSSTWLVVAETAKTTLSLAHAILGGDDQAQLASRNDVTALRGREAQTLGFVSLTGAVVLGEETDGAEQIAHTRSTLQKLDALPDHGLTPIIVMGEAVPPDGTRISATLSPAALGTVFRWAMP